MDERHWWIAGKIQESFHIGGYDNPTLLEDFMCEPETLEMINHFLNAGGPCRIFFYCDKPESDTLSTRQLHTTGSLATLKDVVLDDITILYFLRKSVDYDVDQSHIEKDVFCGELKGNAIEGLSTLLTEIYMPLLRAQKDWGQCSQENKELFMHNMEKFVNTLADSAGSSHSSKQLVGLLLNLSLDLHINFTGLCVMDVVSSFWERGCTDLLHPFFLSSGFSK